MPFAVVGSNTIIDGDEGKRVRGRKYPWGTVIIENKVILLLLVLLPGYFKVICVF